MDFGSQATDFLETRVGPRAVIGADQDLKIELTVGTITLDGHFVCLLLLVLSIPAYDCV